jgi:hypothetical protein
MEIYAHMIHGQDDAAAGKLEEYRKRNSAEKRTAVQ